MKCYENSKYEQTNFKNTKEKKKISRPTLKTPKKRKKSVDHL